MIKILLVGATGAMGKTILETLPQDMAVINGIGQGELDNLEVFETFEDLENEFDVIVDFSHVSLLEKTLQYALKHQRPLLIASTGLQEKHHALIDEASQAIPIIQSGNYSFGVYALNEAVKLLTKILKDSDIEITEKHHRYKKDAPSGTAQMIVDSVLSQRESGRVIYGREGQSDVRDPKEIAVHALRGGTIVGEHSVLFALEDEEIEIKHHASSKKIFAEGAYKAIRFIIQKEKGRYGLEDVVNG